jgi:DNA modification methylase
MNYLNSIICGDSCNVLKNIPEDIVDMVITSPPYDKLRNYNGYSFDFECIAPELLRVLKPGGVIIWVVGDATKNGSESGTSFKQALHFMSLGFNLHDTMIYIKSNYVPLTHNRYEQAFEYMFCFSKGRPKTFNPIKIPCKYAGHGTDKRTFYQTAEDIVPQKGHKQCAVSEDKIAPNIFSYHVGGKKEFKGHPAIFPEKLVEDQLLTWSLPSDIILDPFCGSGTTCAVAKRHNRNYIGIEISEEFCNLSESRVSSESTIIIENKFFEQLF